MNIAEQQINWRPSWRLVPSRFPPMSLFDRVAKAEDLDAVIAIESLTNDRLRNEIGELNLVPVEERQSGPGTTPIMAAFTHVNPEGSRFSDGRYGVYYAALHIDTAIRETVYHRERFLRLTEEPPIEIDMRSYASNIDCAFHDVRKESGALNTSDYDKTYDKTDYGFSQSLAQTLRSSGSNGIVYDSVRHEGGECLAVFRANIPSPVTQGSHYCFVWNGDRIDYIYRKEGGRSLT